jgi:hypothetical protein
MIPLPPHPDDTGKPPRKVDALRGNIARLVNANRDRVAHVEEAARQERERQAYRRRLRSLAQRISEITRSFIETEFDTLRGGGNGMPARDDDFTGGELLDYLLEKLDMNCKGCGYYLRGLPPSGNCPECGHRYFTGVLEFGTLRMVLAQQLELPVAHAGPEVRVLARLRELCAIEEDAKRPPLNLSE